MACDNLLWINKNTNDKELIQTAVKGIGFFYNITDKKVRFVIGHRTISIIDRSISGLSGQAITGKP